MTRRQLVSQVRLLGIVGVGYFVAGKFGLMMAFVNPSATAVWPPTGIALASMVLLGYRVWPAILVGAFFVNVTTAGNLATSVGVAAGNTLEAVIGAFLIKRFCGGRNVFDRPDTVFKFALLAAMTSTLVSPTLGVTSLCLGGWASWANYSAIWLTWWLGDAAGDLIVAPLVLLWALNPRIQWSLRQIGEAALLFAAVVAVGLIVFGGSRFGDGSQPLQFLCIPLVVWGASRFSQREAATATFLLSTIAIWGTLRGFGPFVSESPHESLLMLQAYMGVISLMGIVLAAAISERKRFETQLVHLADHDSLTDFLSRRRFQAELWRHLAEARRYGTHGSVLFLDLDDFKLVNDSMGHLHGDEILAALAALLRGRLRDTDLLARLGGDEFAILLPHTGEGDARALAEHLVGAIRLHPFQIAGRTLVVTASIGIALFPEHGTTVEQLLACADSAMYRAKETGRNCACVYDPYIYGRGRPEATLALIEDVRDALDKGRFLLHGQPILDLRRNRVAQYELLLRMVAGQDELVLPHAFLGTAERAGMIQAIDRWVVAEAIGLIERKRGRAVDLSVNLSPRAFGDTELLPMMRRELSARSVNPANLILEISETTALADTDQARSFTAAVKALGCRTALDDFGVGFSSLHHLKRLPVDYLKIDGSFVRDFRSDHVDQHLVRAIVEVARALGKKTIAEFVSDAETLQLLRESGVDYAQGFHIGRPAAIGDVWA